MERLSRGLRSVGWTLVTGQGLKGAPKSSQSFGAGVACFKYFSGLTCLAT